MHSLGLLSIKMVRQQVANKSTTTESVLVNGGWRIGHLTRSFIMGTN